MDKNLHYHYLDLSDIDIYAFETPREQIRGLVMYVLTFIELLLITEFLLQLFNVTATGVFTDIVHSSTHYLLLPFSWAFTTPEISLINWATVIAISVYGLLGLGISKFLGRRTTFSLIEAARAQSKKKYQG